MASERPGGERQRWRRWAPLQAAVFLCLVFVVSAGCEKEDMSPVSRAAFSDIVDEAEDLYSRLHPLRSSRLGITASDSLLFTFESSEVESVLIEIDSLLARVSTLPASHFGPEELDDSATLIDWLRGETFALRELRLFSHNPMLYCWMTREALYGIPSRSTPPPRGEFEAYDRRISQIPDLLANAVMTLDNPAEIFFSPAYGSMISILSDFDRLRSLSRTRYGKIPPSLDAAQSSIETFTDFLLEDVGEKARGRFILGIEALSDILGFSEGLDIDLEKTATDAEKSMRKYLSQVSSIERNPSYSSAETGSGTRPGIEAMIDSIETLVAGRKLFGPRGDFDIPVLRIRPPPLQTVLPVNPYLLIPAREPDAIISQTGSMFSNDRCGTTVIVSPGEERMSYLENWYRLMAVSSVVTGVERKICSDGKTIPALLLSELYILGWERINLKEMISLDDGMKMALRKIHLKKKINDMTIMIVVFRLHSGIFDLDSATTFVARSLSIAEDEARQKVVLAATSPSVAMPGLAAFLGDRLIQKASTIRGERRPRERVRRWMTEYRGRPLGLILDRVDR